MISPSDAQNKLVFDLQLVDSNSVIPSKYTIPEHVPDSLSGLKVLNDLIIQLQSDGFLLASADSIELRNNTFHSRVFVGNRYQWKRIKIMDLEGNPKYEINNRRWAKNTSSKSLFLKTLQQSNNHGYPFAFVTLDSVIISSGIIDGMATLNPGPLIAFDTLLIAPINKSRTKYLSKYLRILPGKPYNEKAVKQIPDNMKLIPYYRLISPVGMVIHNNNALINFEIEKSALIDWME
ncbi:MAG: hypothetical protein O2951_04150 [Bacteroidetes bacterium]|nr:hypothetical protein [Bacteroidota bacterium]